MQSSISNHQSEIEIIIPLHREQFLRREESRLLTAARQPGAKANPEIAAQLAAHSHAEELEDIHAVYESHFLSRACNDPRATRHTRLKHCAHQLKLLALETLSRLL